MDDVTVSLSQDNTINIMIGSERFSALVDTGCSRTLINEQVLNAFSWLKDNFLEATPDTQVVGTTANGQSMQFTGEVTVPIRVESKTFDIECLVGPTVVYPVILGNDFLRETGSTLSFTANTIQMKQPLSLGCRQATVIPAWSEVCMRVKVMDYERPIEGDGLVEGASTLDSLGILVARSLSRLKDNTTVMRILNPLGREVIIPEQSLVGIFTPLEEDDQVMEITEKDRTKTEVSDIRVNSLSMGQTEITRHHKFEELFNVPQSDLTQDQTKRLYDFLWKNRAVFQFPGEPLGHTDLVEHEIHPKPDFKGWRSRPYRSNPALRREIESQVKRMLKEDIIEPSISPFSSPVLLVQKADRTWRLVIDYRRANSQLL